MIYFICTVIFTISLTKASEYHSVILWDVPSDVRPTLAKFDSLEFGNYIIPDISNSMLVAFVGRDQCVNTEDFSKCKSSTGELCFKELSQMKNKAYYPNVERPIYVLKNTTFKKEYLNVNENADSISCEEGKIVFVDLPKCDEENTKEESLSTLDSFIHNFYNKLPCDAGSKIGMYTVEKPNYSNNLKRLPRQAQAPSSDVNNDKPQNQQQQKPNQPSKDQKGITLVIKNKLLLHYQKLSYKDESNEIKTLNVDRYDLLNETESGFNVTLSGGGQKINFRIDTKNGYWDINNIQLNDVYVQTNTLGYISNGFSYYCGNSTFTNNDGKVTLYWENLQLQPIERSNSSTVVFKFDDPWHCVGFTSVGIWSGLFVTIMLLLILSIGISWLMDIRTMDRFDDAKGKTITVNTSD